MSKQLLQTTLKAYMLFSLAVLLVSAPLFYWVTERLYIDEADETLNLLKTEFLHNTLPAFRIADITSWNAINRDVKIEKPLRLTRDSIFQTFYQDSIVNELEPYRVLWTPVKIENQAYTLRAKLNLVEAEDMVESIAILFCAVLGVLLIGLYFITKYLSVRLWRPFYSTLDHLEKFNLGKTDRPISDPTDIEEFRRMNQSIDKLLERNIRVYESQREFAENASHELQTPLAIFQAKLDTLAQQVPLTAELSETLSALTEATVRLTRTNKNLMLLSRIDNNQFPDLENISVAEVAEKQFVFFREQARERNVKVRINVSDPLVVSANLNLVEVAISNLLLNAVRHNVPGGEVTIDITPSVFKVSNTGHTQALSASRLFQRFSTQGPEKNGSGLGLSIVKKIVELNLWTIEYSFDEGLHVFQLRFR